jgi:hypothetical protein
MMEGISLPETSETNEASDERMRVLLPLRDRMRLEMEGVMEERNDDR